MDVSQVVSATLTSNSRGPRTKGFGVGLCLSASPSSTWLTSEKVRSYTSPAGVLVDFAAGTPEYVTATKYFGQKNKPPTMKIGRLTSKPALKYVISIATLLDTTRYAFMLGSVEIFDTSGSSATAAAIAGLLAAKVTAAAITGVSAAVVGNTLEITETAGTWVVPVLKNASGQVTGPGIGDGTNLLGLACTATEPATPMATQLNAILAENSDWYALMNPYYSKAICSANASWANGVERIYIQATPDTDVITTVPSGATDVAATLKGQSYSRSAVLAHHRGDQMPEVAWLGRRLPVPVGKVNYAFAELEGVEIQALTDTHVNNVVTTKDNVGKNGNVYVDVAGLGTTWNGRMADGGWIDLRISSDWILARLRERMFAVLHGDEKLPQTNAGIAVAEGILRGVFRDAQKAGILSSDRKPTFEIPKIEDIEEADLQERVLPDMNAEAFFGGAFNQVKFQLALRV